MPHPLADGLRSREDLADAHEGRRLAEALLGFRVEAGVRQRQGELACDRHREVHLPGLEGRRPLAVVQGHDAGDLVLPDQRHDEVGSEGEGLDPLAREEVARPRVVHDHRAAALEGPRVRRDLVEGPRGHPLEGGPLLRGLPSVGVLRHERRDLAAFPDGDRATVDAAHLGDLDRDALEQPLRVERGVEDLDDLEQRAGLLQTPRSLRVEPSLVEGDRGLVGERLGDLRVARGERPSCPERQRADRPGADPQRHAEEHRVAEPAVRLDVLGGDIRDALDLADERPPGRHDPTAQTLAHPDPWTRHGLRRRAGQAGQDELLALEQPEAGIVHVEEPRGFLGDRGEQRLRRHHAADLLVDLEERAEVRAPGALLGELAGVVERVRRVEGERAQHVELLAGVLVALAHADRERAEHSVPDEEGNDRGRRCPLGAELRDVAGPRVPEDVGHGQGLARGDDRPHESLPDTEGGPPLARAPRADRRAQRDLGAVVIDQPEPRDARVEQLGGCVHHALDHLVDRQRRGECLREPRERLQAPAPLAGLDEAGGASDGLADLVRDCLQERQLVAVERARLSRDERHDAPDRAAHGDRQRELRVVAAGDDPLAHRGREHARPRQVGQDEVTRAHRLADVARVERAHAQHGDVLGREASVGDEHERLRHGVEPEEAAKRRPRDAADDLERALGGGHEIVTVARRDRDGAERLERVGAIPLLCRATHGGRRPPGPRSDTRRLRGPRADGPTRPRGLGSRRARDNSARDQRDARRGDERERPGEPEPSLRDAPGPLGDQRPETLARRVVERPREPRLAVDRDASTTRRVPPAPRRHAGQRPADGQVLHQHHHGGS